MNLFKRIFSKEKEKNLSPPPKYNWINISFKEHYDISNMPDLSPKSPIKHFSLPYLYRYCPNNNKLMRRTLSKSEWYDVDIDTEINKHEDLKIRIYELTVDRRRDEIINRILDK